MKPSQQATADNLTDWGAVVANPSVGPIPPPAGAIHCQPEIRNASATEFVLLNLAKPSNFIIGEIVNGQLSFIVENLPKDGTGCPGKWMFAEMMKHFGPSVAAIEGNWLGPLSDNLATANRLTGAGMTLDEAAKATWTGKQAVNWGYMRVQVISALGRPGQYSNVRVVFRV